MGFRDYLRTASRRRRLIVVCTLLGLAAAAAVSMGVTPVYQANVQLFVSVSAGPADIASTYNGSLFSQQRVQSYADIVASPKVTAPVVRQLGLGESPRALASRISADAPLNTVLLNIHVKDSSPQQAQRLANAVAGRFVTVVNQLETPNGVTSSPVKVSIVNPANLPDKPVSPRLALNLPLGLLVGLAIGVGAAVLRETLDTSLKDSNELQEAFGLAGLASIPFDHQAAQGPLCFEGGRDSPRAEAFRQLRTNLQFVDVDDEPRSIVVTSAAPAEGKTTTVINLALARAEAGRPVVVVGGDLRRPEIATQMGLEAAVGLTDVLIGRVSLDDALQDWGDTGRVKVLPSGPVPPNPAELLGSHQMGALLRQLEQRGLVLIDAPPLLPVTDAAVLAASASGAMLVVRANKTQREQVRRALANLRAVGAPVFGTVLNMVPTSGPESYGYKYGYTYDTQRRRGGWRRRHEGSRAVVGAHDEAQELVMGKR